MRGKGTHTWTERRLRRLRVGLVLSLAVAVGAVVAAGVFYTRARRARDEAVARDTEAIEQAIRADEAARLTRALVLAAEGQAAFEDEPLLGLRLAVEGFSRVPWHASEVRASVDHTVRELAKWGRLSRLGGDVAAVYANPQGSLLVLGRAYRAGELRRTSDGSLVVTLAGQVSEVSFSPDPDATLVSIAYDDAPGELRRAPDGSIIAAGVSRRSPVVFSPDPDARYFVVSYEDAPGELRQTADGSLIARLTGEVGGAVFSADAAATYVAIDYTDAFDELRRTDDGSLVVEFSHPVERVYFGPRPGVPYFLVGYRDSPGELRRTVDGSHVAWLPGEVRGVYADSMASSFVVSYTDAPDELRRASDGSLIAPVAGRVKDVIFSPDPDAACFAISYYDAPGELRRTADGSLVPLEEDVRWDGAFGVFFSPDGGYLLIEDRETFDLFRTIDGSWEAGGMAWWAFSPDGSLFLKENYPEMTVDGPFSVLLDLDDGSGSAEFPSWIESVHFSPALTETYAVVDQGDAPDVLLRTTDGSPVVTFTAEIDQGFFSPDGAYVIADYETRPGEVRRAVDGSPVVTLTAEVGQVWPSPDPLESSLFVVAYADGRSEVWDWQDTPHRLAELGLGMAGYVFDLEDGRMVVWHSDGRVYLLDIDWLRAMGGDLAVLSGEDVVRLACEGPFGSGLFDEARLERYLDGGLPEGCR